MNPDHAGSLGHGRVNFARALSEVHAGVVLGQGSFHSPAGKAFFLAGDTVTLSLPVKNVLTHPAENLSFDLSASSVLTLLGITHAPKRLDPGAEDSIDALFYVGSVARKQDVHVRLRWNATTGESDARIFNTTVYPGEGYWERQQNPSGVPLWSVHAVSGRVAWAAGITWGASTVLRTVDGGENWTSAMGDFPGDAGPVVIFALDSLHAWVGGYSGGIYVTTDGGVSWRSQAYPKPLSTFIDGFHFSDAMHGCAIGELGTASGKFVVLQTSDGGTTWTHIPNEPAGASDEFGWLTAFSRSNPQHFWFVSWYGGQSRSRIRHSGDGGDTWSLLVDRSGSVNALAMRDDSVGLLCSGNVKNSDPAYFGLTTNGGTTWQPLSNVLTEKGVLAAYPAGSTKAWMAGQHTVAYSSNNGASWVEQPTDRVSGAFSAISLSDPAHGWMVTWNGEILRYRTRGEPVTEAVPPAVGVPSQAMLEQNYPNPFNPKTGVRFQVSGVSDVKITVYDLLGREVAVLVNERKPAGSYEVSFDGSGLASGVYFYRLNAGAFVQSKRMILIK